MALHCNLPLIGMKSGSIFMSKRSMQNAEQQN